MTVNFSKIGDEGYLMKFADGQEKAINRAELLSVMLNAGHAYCQSHAMEVTPEHRAAIAAHHDSLVHWLGLDDAPKACNHGVDLGASWLDIQDDGFLMSSVQMARDKDGDFRVAGGHSYFLDRQTAAQLVHGMCEQLLAGQCGITDALRLKSMVNTAVNQIQQGLQTARRNSAMLHASYVSAAQSIQARGPLLDSVLSLAPSDGVILEELCADLGDKFSPVDVRRYSGELRKLKAAIEKSFLDQADRLLAVVHGSSAYEHLRDSGFGYKMNTNTPTTDSLRGSVIRSSRDLIEGSGDALRKTLVRQLGDIVTLKAKQTEFGDVLSGIYLQAVEQALADPALRELPENLARRIASLTNSWWDDVLGTTARDNGLQMMDLTPGQNFGNYSTPSETAVLHSRRMFVFKLS